MPSRRRRKPGKLTKSLLPEVRRDGHFQIVLDERGMRGGHDEVIRALHERVMAPIIRSAEAVYVFNVAADAAAMRSARKKARKQRDAWLAAYARPHKGDLRCDLENETIHQETEFWTWLWRGGYASELCPVILVRRPQLEWLFRHSANPYLTWNVEARIPASARRFVRAHTSQSVAALITELGTAAIEFTVTAPRSAIGQLFLLAGSLARLDRGIHFMGSSV